MARKLDPMMMAVLAAGAAGTGLAIISGAAMWLAASGFGVSYEIDGAESVGLRHVIVNLVVVGLIATAVALLLQRAKKAVLMFLVLCLLALGVSLPTPITVAADFSTATVLVVHHVLAGILIAVPLTRSLAAAKFGERS